MSDPGEPDAPRLSAGSAGPERHAPRPDPAVPRWFEPPHIRAPEETRAVLAALVAAGADTLVAPTWLTHRRALLPVGETRRARAWTEAAVRVAREAAEVGAEARARAAEAAAEAAHAAGHAPGPGLAALPPVRVAGWLPALDATDEPGTGRLAARDVAVARDLRTQAGLLGDAGADLVLVGPARTLAGARAATEAATEHGLRPWVTGALGGSPADPRLPDGTDPAAWAETLAHAGAAALLLLPAQAALVPAALAQVRAGAPVPAGVLATLRAAGAAGAAAPAEPATPAQAEADDAPDAEPRDTAAAPRDPLAVAAARWLDAGAVHLGIDDGATPAAIATLRAVLDAAAEARLQARAAEAATTLARIRDAARRAPGGRAAWVGGGGSPARSGAEVRPAGFAWVVVSAADGARLPARTFTLVVADADASAHARVLGAAVATGGILLAACAPDAAATLRADVHAAGLRIVSMDTGPEATRILARREP
ncbi:MAG: homocysteine S-methyltransferase family protein [Chloroflexota bacterium]